MSIIDETFKRLGDEQSRLRGKPPILQPAPDPRADLGYVVGSRKRRLLLPAVIVAVAGVILLVGLSMLPAPPSPESLRGAGAVAPDTAASPSPAMVGQVPQQPAMGEPIGLHRQELAPAWYAKGWDAATAGNWPDAFSAWESGLSGLPRDRTVIAGNSYTRMSAFTTALRQYAKGLPVIGVRQRSGHGRVEYRLVVFPFGGGTRQLLPQVQSVFARAGLINAAHLQARLPGEKEASPPRDKGATGAHSEIPGDGKVGKPEREPVRPAEAVAPVAVATSNLFTASRMPVDKADAFAGDPAGPVLTERSISWNNLSHRVIEQLKAESYADAVDSAGELTREFPERWESWYWKGTAQLALGQVKESGASLERAGKVDPGVARVWLQRAVVAQERGDNKEAVRLLLEARKLAPKSPQIYLNLGYSNDALGLSAEAEKNYQYFMALTEGDNAYLLQRTLVIERLERK